MLDSKDSLANYQLGVMSLLGLACEKNVTDAVLHFEIAEADAHALNALGVIYYGAPDIFEKDPSRTYAFGKIRKDVKKARKYFERASNLGNLNALYNTGVIFLDPESE